MKVFPTLKPIPRKRLLIIAAVFLTLIALIFACAFGYISHMLNRISRPDDSANMSPEDLLASDETMPDGMELPTEDIILGHNPADLIHAEDNVNILLVGQDEKNGGSRGRADTILLCTINITTKTITMTSFLRDSYVQIPDYFPHKINSSYALGGFPLLNETLKHNFGVQVDGNVSVDFSSFEAIVNALGGVTITLTPEETEYLNNDCGFDLTVGENHVDGLTALAYSRIRHLDSDFGRTNRQRAVMTAIMDQCRQLSMREAMNLLEEILPMITTDMTNQEIISIAMDTLPILLNCTLNTQHIPAEGTYTYAWADKMSVLAVDLEANRQILKNTLGE